MKKVAKLLLVLGIAYWVLLIFASLTGCTTVEKSCDFCKSCEQQQKVLHIDELTISLDPLDKKHIFEREEFLQQFENY